MQIRELQLELSGVCNATCSYCNWRERTAGRARMDTALAERLIREAAMLQVGMVTYHGVGESTLHCDLYDLLLLGESLGLQQRLSTNCYLLDRWMDRLATLTSTEVILALHVGLEPAFVGRCWDNAIDYLCSKPVNRAVQVLLVCEADQAKYASQILDTFLPLVERVKGAYIHFKQPQTWPGMAPVSGSVPDVPKHPRIDLDTVTTPRSLARGCSMPDYLLQVMADGTTAPCCVATHDWGLPNAGEVGLAGVWNSPRFHELRSLWHVAAESIPCGHCIKRTDC